MEQLSAFSSVADILHALSQGLLVPDIILLLAFAGYALFCIGSIVMEFFTERRNYRINTPKFLNDLMKADEEDIPEVIRTSGLLNRQKTALLTVYDYRTLHDDALLALVRRTVFAEQERYDAITGRNNTAAKISPMLGLMGTLIPLGPGVAALGQADTSALSASLLVAFDTTVAGLAVAAVCLAVGKIRSNWYGDYLNTLESAMATLLQKIEDMRAEGKLEATEPSDYAFLFEKGLKDQPEPTRTQETHAPAASPTEGSSDTATPGTASANAPRSAGYTSHAAEATGAAAVAGAMPAGEAPSPAASVPATNAAGATGATVASAPASTAAPEAATQAPAANEDNIPAWQREAFRSIAARAQAIAEKQAPGASPASANPTTPANPAGEGGIDG